MAQDDYTIRLGLNIALTNVFLTLSLVPLYMYFYKVEEKKE